MTNTIVPPIYTDYLYTQSFTHTIDSITSVFYATAEMNAHTFSPFYPGNSTLKFIWYEIDVHNYSSVHLTTRVSGFFQLPYFSQFSFSFLAVYTNNPFMNNYLSLNYI